MQQHSEGMGMHGEAPSSNAKHMTVPKVAVTVVGAAIGIPFGPVGIGVGAAAGAAVDLLRHKLGHKVTLSISPPPPVVSKASMTVKKAPPKIVLRAKPSTSAALATAAHASLAKVPVATLAHLKAAPPAATPGEAKTDITLDLAEPKPVAIKSYAGIFQVYPPKYSQVDSASASPNEAWISPLNFITGPTSSVQIMLDGKPGTVVLHWQSHAYDPPEQGTTTLTFV